MILLLLPLDKNCQTFVLQEKIESSTDVLEGILKPVVGEEEEIPWPPRDPEALKIMEKVRVILLISFSCLYYELNFIFKT